MNYIYAFLFAGVACLIAQIILDNTKLTPGHITSLFTVGGAILSFLGIYDKFIGKFGAGATVLISNFGHNLYQGAIEGFYENGVLGIFGGMLSKSSLAIVAAIVFSFFISFFFNSKD